MKRVNIIGVILLLGLSKLLNAQTINIPIDINEEFQTITGFGADIPGWRYHLNSSSKVADLAINDLGLTILRYNPEPGFESQNENDDPFTMGTFNVTEQYTVQQIKSAKAFAEKGLEKLILSVFSPPKWMKYNNSLEGSDCMYNDPACNNRLIHDYYDEYAEFYAAYIKHIEDQVGMDVYAISPANEPRWGQWFSSCVYATDELVEVVKVLGQKFENEKLGTKIFASEDLLVLFGEYERVLMEDSVCKNYIDAIATHAYADGIQPTDISSAAGLWSKAGKFALEHEKEFWMTETSGYSEKYEDGPLVYAQLMHTALTYGNVSAWIWLMVNTDKGGNEQEALMINENPRKIYYASKNFYRYIRPGAKRVKVQDNEAEQVFVSAYTHGEDSRLTIVAINTSTSPKTISLEMLNRPKQFKHYRTSQTENCDSMGISNGIGIVLQPQSINTFVAEGSNHLPTIHSIKDTTILMNTTDSIVFQLSGISDGDNFSQMLNITATSSNNELMPNSKLSYSYGNSNGTLVVYPQKDFSGTATISIHLKDDGGTDNNGFFSEHLMSFDIKVLPYINHGPTIDNIPDYSFDISEGAQSITLTGISDGNSSDRNIKFKSSVDPTKVIFGYKVDYEQGSSEAKFNFKLGSEGTTKVTIVMEDDGDNDLNGNNKTTISFNINVTNKLSVPDLRNGSIDIYPNPASQYFKIKTSKDYSEQCTVEIFDALGNLYFSEVKTFENGIINISTDQFLNGLYYVRLRSGNENLTSKLVVRK